VNCSSTTASGASSRTSVRIDDRQRQIALPSDAFSQGCKFHKQHADPLRTNLQLDGKLDGRTGVARNNVDLTLAQHCEDRRKGSAAATASASDRRTCIQQDRRVNSSVTECNRLSAIDQRQRIRATGQRRFGHWQRAEA
jgi:hypothetical protein